MKLELTTFIVNILIISMLGIIVDMALPNGGFKRYAKFLINIIMLTMILKPFLSIDRVSLFNEGMYSRYDYLDEIDVGTKTQTIDRIQDRQVKELFKQKIENQIKVQIESSMGCRDAVVVVELRDTGDQLYNIEKIYIKARYLDTNSRTLDIDLNSHDRDFEDDVVGYLSSLYNVQKESITIEIDR